MDKARISLAEAEGLAAEVVALISPFCERIEVLGSIRRKRETVGDIEIGLIPKIEEETDESDLFCDNTITVNRDLVATKRMIAEGTFGLRPNKNEGFTCGEGTKFLTYRGFALDVFGCMNPLAWGVTKLIRTGSGDFNKRVVLQRVAGGTILPLGMRFEGGRLLDRQVPVPTPEEIDVFNAIGMAYIEPEARNG